MPEKLKPPFTIGQTDDSFWVQDANGLRFGYCCVQTASQIGAEPGRMNRVMALRTVRWIKRMAEEAAT